MRYLVNRPRPRNMGRRQPSMGVGDEQTVARNRRPSDQSSAATSSASRQQPQQQLQQRQEPQWEPPPTPPNEVQSRYKNNNGGSGGATSAVSSLREASSSSSPSSSLPVAVAIEDDETNDSTVSSDADFVETARNQIAVVQSFGSSLLVGGTDLVELSRATDSLRYIQIQMKSYFDDIGNIDADFLNEILVLNELVHEALDFSDSIMASWIADVPENTKESSSQHLPTIPRSRQKSPLMPSIVEDSTSRASQDDDETEATGYHRTSLDHTFLALQGDINGLLCMLRAAQADKRLGAAQALLDFCSGISDKDMAPYWQTEILSYGGLESLLDAGRRGSHDLKAVVAQTIAHCLLSWNYASTTSGTSTASLQQPNRVLQALQFLATCDMYTRTAARGMIAFWFQYLEPLLQNEITHLSAVDEQDICWLPLDHRSSGGIDAASESTTRRHEKVQKLLERTVVVMLQIGKQQPVATIPSGQSWNDALNGLMELCGRVKVAHDVRFALDQMQTLLQTKPVSRNNSLPPPPPPPAWSISEVESHQLNAAASYAQVEANGPARDAESFAPVDKTPAKRLSQVDIQTANGQTVQGSIITANDQKAYWLGDKIKGCIFGYVCEGTVLHKNGEKWQASADRVAIKVLSLDTMRKRSDALENPETEFATMAHVHHEAQRDDASTIIATLDLWRDETSIYLVMPYCETRLFDLVKKSGRLEESEARVWFKQILEVRTMRVSIILLSFFS